MEKSWFVYIVECSDGTYYTGTISCPFSVIIFFIYRLKDMRKPKGYWTKEKCHEESLKFETRKEFALKSSTAYTKSMKNEWLDDICNHMIQKYKSSGYWTKEKCHEESLKYTTKGEFKKYGKGSYSASIRNGWHDELCSHMHQTSKPAGYWTKEKCHEESLKYSKRIDFCNNSSSAYTKSLKMNWIDDICSHMITIGNLYNRCIYVAKFSDNSCYVGLTYDIKKREKNHLTNKKSTVYQHIKKTGLQPVFEQLTDYIDINESKKKENEFVLLYKKDYFILNKRKTGSIGGHKKWIKETCKEESLKYTIKKDFRTKSSGAYRVAYKQGWLDEICEHMEKSTKKPNGYWTKDRCEEEILKYKTKTELFKNNQTIHQVIKKNGWYELYDNLIITNKPNGYWTKDRCKEESLKYKTKTEFKKNSGSAYNSMHRNGWKEDLFPKKKWYVYLVESSGDNILYCGMTNNLDKRIKIHNSGKGSKALRGSRLPVKLYKYWKFKTKSEALKEEYRIKKLTRKEKLKLN